MVGCVFRKENARWGRLVCRPVEARREGEAGFGSEVTAPAARPYGRLPARREGEAGITSEAWSPAAPADARLPARESPDLSAKTPDTPRS